MIPDRGHGTQWPLRTELRPFQTDRTKQERFHLLGAKTEFCCRDRLNSETMNMQPPRCPKQCPRQAGSPQTTPALALAEFSFGYIHTLPGNAIPGLQREARQHLAAPCRRETAQLLHRELTQSNAQTGGQKGSICPTSSKQTPMAPSRH